MKLQVGSGSPEPLGVTPDAQGVNVAVYSAHASAIEFCLFDIQGQQQTHAITLPARTGEVFHAYIAGVAVGARYGLRAYGPDAPHLGHRFNSAKLLVDPYALVLDRPFTLDARLYGFGDYAAADSSTVVPKAIITNRNDLAKPLTQIRIPWADTVIYELHVRGFTKLHPEIPETIRGTFAALAEPAAIAHLRDLGVSTVELMPAAAWIDERHLPPLGLGNYWGYNPVTLMAPDPRLAPGGWPEIRRAVDALHGAGLEVILDVVLNHSGEGDELGPTLSLRGLDNASYYRLNPAEPERYVNDMGCGNCLALNRPSVLRLAMDSLRTWIELGGIDGFRFDLATALGRDDTGFNAAAPLLAAIAQDPLLREAKLVAEPWDIGPGGYQIGRFPASYGEWNDRFRDDTRRFWRGDASMRGALATRLAGSADLFAAKCRPSRSINFITAHDGFTLSDLVSYARKHNDANGENNRDGQNENFSWNHGHEGQSDDAACLALRARDQRNLLATLLLSRGTPMLSMGAELGITQRGNNNAYAQDNTTTWLDWARADHDLVTFTRNVIALRRAHPALRDEKFLTGVADHETGLPDVEWRTGHVVLKSEDDWKNNHDSTLIAILTVAGGADRVALILNSGDKPEPLNLPEPRQNFIWRLELDTRNNTDKGDTNIAPRSVALFAETAVQPRTIRAPDAYLLARLAGAAGIAPDWWDIAGNRHAVSEETQRTLLRAMGLEAATHTQAQESLAQVVCAASARLLPESHMVYADEEAVLPVTRAACDVWPLRALILRSASGHLVATLAPYWRQAQRSTNALGHEIRVFTLSLPPLQTGHYIVCFEDAPETICHLTAAPKHCYLPPDFSQRRFGISVQTYSLRRAGDAGIGDFSALGQFAAAAGQHGAATVGIQPLHMLFPAARERASPYHPSDRRHLDPIHLALDGLSDIPGFADTVHIPTSDMIDYPAVWSIKSRFLDALFVKFEAVAQIQPTHPIVQEFENFIIAGGAQLKKFATFQVIEHLYPDTAWPVWPGSLHDAADAQVDEIIYSHQKEHRCMVFLQFLCDRQLGAAATAAHDAGLAWGLYRDLAVGCAPDGAEAWANAGIFAQNVSIGAPPDPLGPEGQVWNLPPPNPLAWSRTNFASFRSAIAANMRHAGALRIDHVLGLSRLFWVPDGGRAMDGAYVQYPLDTLIGHLALESQKANCIVVGEDLGTVPNGLRATLARAKILSYRVMMLERSRENFISPRLYPAAALACAATHDLPPLAGWWQGTDIAERHALGLIDDATHVSQRAFREVEKQALLNAMAEEDIVVNYPDNEILSDAMLGAIHAWLARAPSALLMVQAEDLAGEIASQNLPGTNRERPNWRRRLPLTVEELFASERARHGLQALRERQGT
jgi:glycogen operon protein